MSRLPSCLFSLLCLLLILTGQISGLIWRKPRPQTTYPANPADSFYQAFQTVPPLRVTADKFKSSFFGSHWSGNSKRSLRNEDIVVVIDGSGSVGSCEFVKGKKALEHLMGKMVRPDRDTRYAAVTFSSYSQVNFKFKPYSIAASRIMNIPYPGGSTNTQAGLADAKRLLFDDPSSGGRGSSEKVVILITDGQSNEQRHLTIPNAQELKKRQVKILVVAVGSYISGIDEMVKVASDPPTDHMFRVKSLGEFHEIVRLILEEVFPGKWNISSGQYNPPC